MAFQFGVDRDRCFNCGICMDTCPFQSLDMTRSDPARTDDLVHTEQRAWMMEFPVQVAKCTGCRICQLECPTQAISILKTEAPVVLAPAQGPRDTEPPDDNQWRPLTANTRASLRDGRSRDPWPLADLTWKTVPHAKRRDQRFDFTA